LTVEDEGRALQARVEHIDRLSEERDLTNIVGRYFVALDDIEVRVETSIRNGEQESYSARRAVAAGTTLLVGRMRFLDDILHSVEMLAHPADPDQTRLPFMADEFFTHFLPAEEGVREKERAAVLAEMDAATARIRQTQQQIAIAGPTQQRPADKALVVVKSKSESLAERMKTMVAVAEERKSLVEAEGAKIRDLETVFKRFMSEMSTSALGMIADQIEFATSVTTGLKTLSFYTGEGVDVTTLRTGASAPSNAPLTLYQSLLYLDEELAVNLLDQGFDYRLLGDLPDILSDRSLIDRMIPAVRGAVLVRVRREDVVYVPVKTLGDAMLNAELNMENKISYLLVKDGENLHLVHSEVTSDESRHLFPARKEIDDIFRKHGREVLPEHLEYSNSKDNFEQRTILYRRLLLMMWGLDERLGLFGDFHADGEYDGWFDDRFHAERVVYLHDAENVIEQSRPSFAQWAEEKNRHVQTGSRIAAFWPAFFNDESIPDAWDWSRARNHDQILFPEEIHSVVKAEKKGAVLVVRTMASERYGKKKAKSVTVTVAEGLMPHSGLCLDFVDRSELQYYLNSRKERRAYSSFLASYRMIDEYLKREEETQAKTLEDLRERMSHAGLTPDVASAALAKAVVLWRAQNGGALVGGPGWKPKNVTLILDMAFALAGARNDLFERARQDIAGVHPLELRIDGKGDLLLYRELERGEGFDGIEFFDDVWVAKTRLRIARNGVVSEAAPAEAVYLQNPDFERRSYRRDSRVFRRFDREITLVGDAERSKKWLGTHQPDWLMPEEARNIAAAVDVNVSEALASLTPTVVRANLWHILHGNYSIGGHQRRVDFGRVVIPLGILRTETRYAVLQLAANGMDVYASFGPVMEAEATGIARRQMETPDDRIKRNALVARTFGPDALPFRFELVWQGLSSVVSGVSFRSAQHSTGDKVRLSPMPKWVGETQVPSPPFDSLEEAVRREAVDATRYKNGEGFALRFINDANRQVAERYFALASKNEGIL
jgi:hypothetical protein